MLVMPHLSLRWLELGARGRGPLGTLAVMAMLGMGSGCDRDSGNVAHSLPSSEAQKSSSRKPADQSPGSRAAALSHPDSDWDSICKNLYKQCRSSATAGEGGAVPAVKADQAAEQLRSSFASWLGKAPAAALHWLQGLPCDSVKLKLTAVAIQSGSGLRHDQAEGLIASCGHLEGSQALMDRYLERWGGSEPEAVAKWLLAAAQSAAVKGAAMPHPKVQVHFSNWAAVAPKDAAAFINQISSDPARDAASAAFARQVVTADPQAAMEWARRIKNPEIRKATVSTLEAVATQLIFQGNSKAESPPTDR